MEHAVVDADGRDGRAACWCARGSRCSAGTCWRRYRPERRPRIGRVTAVDVRIYEVGPRDGLQAEPTIVATEDKLRFIAHAGRCRAARDRDDLVRFPEGDPAAGRRGELLAALDRRAWRALPGAGAEPARPGARRRRGRGRHLPDHRRHRLVRAPQHRHEPSRSRWPPSSRSPPRPGSAAGGSAPTSAPPSAARTRARWMPAPWSAVRSGCCAMGVDELSISDTVGVAAPADVERVLGALAAAGIGPDVIGLHLHDTRGTALANVMAAMEAGVTTFDASTGGTGGSPFAPGAAGNLATEDLVYLLDRQGAAPRRRPGRRAGGGPIHRHRARPQRAGQQGGSCRRVAAVGWSRWSRCLRGRRRASGCRSSWTSTRGSTTWWPCSSRRPPRS